MEQQKTVLVTGGAGYIGSVLVRLLLQEGFRVRVLDSLMFGGEALVDVFQHPNFELVKADLRHEAATAKALQGCWAVAHLAAIVGDPACKQQPELATEVNQTASQQLFALAAKAGVERFVFASTCSNYGKMTDPEAVLNEDSELRPVSLYAELKVGFEQFLMATTTGPAFTILRFSTVYGFSPRVRFDLTVNEFTRDVSLGRELVIFGPQFWRPYCHVNDLARSVVLCLQSPQNKVQGRVFNVGDSTENYTKGMLVEEIGKVIPGINVRFVEKAEDPRDYRVNFDRIAAELGFSITRRVPDGIREIHRLVQSGLFADWDHPRFRNSEG